MADQNTETKTPDEEFAAAFAAELAPQDDQGEPAAEGAADDENKGEPAAAEGAEGKENKGEPDAQGEPAAADDQQEPDYKAEAERLAAELAEAKKAPAKTEPAKDDNDELEFQAPEPPTAASVLNDEERGIVETYETEWPDVSKAEGLKRKVEMAIMKDEIYREVAEALKGVLGTVNPIVQSAQQTAEQAHYAAIEAAHPDYLEVAEAIDGWIEKQPKYLQTAMNAVLDNGSAVEVNDLFSRFKQETGRVAPQVKPDQSLLQSKPAVDEKVVQAMSPVTTGRSAAVSSAVDPNDFGGAWKEAAAK